MPYLTDIPQEIDNLGFCKVLNVRYEVIHIKHIFTEVFVRKSIDIQKYLDIIGWNLFQYMEYMTNQLRKIHHFTREYKYNLDEIVKSDRDNFFPLINQVEGHNNVIILDFDGVCTEYQFQKHLYELCIERCNTQICTANPNVKEEYFINKNLKIPTKIHACKGKVNKLKALLHLNQKYDYCFYVDNEIEYLEFAWLFGIKTFHYTDKKIKHFTLKTK